MPAAGKPGFALAAQEIEWGLGIHGEPGVQRTLDPTGERRSWSACWRRSSQTSPSNQTTGSRCLVNNLGATPTSELNIVAASALEFLVEKGFRVERAWAGTFLSALEMAGISLTLLALDDARLAWLDAPTQTSAWPTLSGRVERVAVQDSPGSADPPLAALTLSPDSPSAQSHRGGLRGALLAAEPTLTEMDRQVGDGDLGISMSRVAQSILQEINTYPDGDRAGCGLSNPVRHSSACDGRHFRSTLCDHAAPRRRRPGTFASTFACRTGREHS